MSISYNRWQKLFFCCFGLFAAAAFCMKWMEGDFLQNGQKFTIIGLEVDSKVKVAGILSGLDEHVKTILQYHLSFDFAFMVGVYPGIAALCMMAREKSGSPVLRKFLIVLAVLQVVAWGCDIAENCYLLKWIKNPVIGNEFSLYHFIVFVKWGLALAGALIAIPLVVRRRKSI